MDELISICNDFAATQDKKVWIHIILDCNGASGAYHQVIKLLNEGYELNSNINIITISAVCNYNEISFADLNHGGNYTHEEYYTLGTRFSSETEDTIINHAGVNNTHVILKLRKERPFEEGIVFRKKYKKASS